MSAKSHIDFNTLGRRRFLRLAVVQAVSMSALSLVSLEELSASQPPSDDLSALITSMAGELFPHDNFPSSVYERVAESVISDMQESESGKSLVLNGLNKVTELEHWSSLNQEQRVRALTNLQSEPLFRYLLGKAVAIIYQDPEVWKIIGYGGSAIEHGGYVHRGFDDISWLPEEN